MSALEILAIKKLPDDWAEDGVNVTTFTFFGREEIVIVAHPNKHPMVFSKGEWKPLP